MGDGDGDGLEIVTLGAALGDLLLVILASLTIHLWLSRRGVCGKQQH
jgi:hypothetical protein